MFVALDDSLDARATAAYEAWKRADEAFTYALAHPDNDGGLDPKEAEQAELDELLRKAKEL